METEARLYENFARFLTLKYPTLNGYWHFSPDGIFTPSHLQRNLYGRLNATSRGWPDFQLAVMAEYDGHTYGGLWIEMKRSNVRLQKRDGTWATDHIAEQAQVLDQLRNRSFVAEFGVGFENCVQIFESYVNSGRLILPESDFFKPGVTITTNLEIESDGELQF